MGEQGSRALLLRQTGLTEAQRIAAVTACAARGFIRAQIAPALTSITEDSDIMSSCFESLARQCEVTVMTRALFTDSNPASDHTY